MTTQDYWTILRRRWLSVAVISVVIVAAAVAYSLTRTKIYAAASQSFVALTSGPNDINPLSGAQFAAQRVKSYAEVVSSPSVLDPVVRDLNLPYSAQALAGKVTATNPPQTVLLLVSATDQSPERAAAIANAVSVQLGRVIEQLETPAKGSTAPVKVTLTEPAVPPASPSSPKTSINIALGVIVGLGVGLAWAFLRNTMDNTVKTETTLTELTGAPALGMVLFDSEAKARPLSALDKTSVRSEGYRTIRTNMQFVNVDSPPQVITVTSPAPGDGKTINACNLAITFAYQGARVCLVEADLRRPRVVEYLGIEGSPGLTEVLSGQVPLDAALRPWGRDLLTVLPPGAHPPNPSELLGSTHMRTVIEKLRTMFNVVIIDSSPLLAVSDAAILAAATDGAVLVVRHGSSTRDQVTHAIAALDQVNVRTLGTVLNAVPARRGYGYGYGYGDRKAAAADGGGSTTSPAA